MKKIVFLAAIAALSACSKKAEEAAPVAEAVATASAAAADSAVGTYDVKMADGTSGKTVINADGTYVDTDAKGAEVKGAFARRDGKDCFDPEGKEPEVCWTVGTPAADGSFKATTPDGKMTVTVSKVK